MKSSAGESQNHPSPTHYVAHDPRRCSNCERIFLVANWTSTTIVIAIGCAKALNALVNFIRGGMSAAAQVPERSLQTSLAIPVAHWMSPRRTSGYTGQSSKLPEDGGKVLAECSTNSPVQPKLFRRSCSPYMSMTSFMSEGSSCVRAAFKVGSRSAGYLKGHSIVSRGSWS